MLSYLPTERLPRRKMLAIEPVFVPLEPPADQVHGQPSPASKFPNADLPDQAADPQTGFTPLEDAAPIPQGHASQIEDAPEDCLSHGGNPFIVIPLSGVKPADGNQTR